MCSHILRSAAILLQHVIDWDLCRGPGTNPQAYNYVSGCNDASMDTKPEKKRSKGFAFGERNQGTSIVQLCEWMQ